MIEVLSREVYLKDKRKHVTNYIETCHSCQVSSRIPPRESVPLNPIPRSGIPWDFIGVDLFLMPYSARGHRYVCTITDLNTKWVEAGALTNKNQTTVWAYLESVFIRWGYPRIILTDQGTEFCNRFIDRRLETRGVDHRTTASYRPATNGQAERTNQILKRQLNRSCGDSLDDWDNILQSAVMGINRTVSASTGFSPFMLMHGWEPQVTRSHTKSHEPASTVEVLIGAENRRERMVQNRERSLASIQRAQDRNRRSHAIRNEIGLMQRPIRAGDRVRLFHARARSRRGFTGPGYYGPFTISSIDRGNLCTIEGDNGEVRSGVSIAQLAKYRDPSFRQHACE